MFTNKSAVYLQKLKLGYVRDKHSHLCRRNISDDEAK